MPAPVRAVSRVSPVSCEAGVVLVITLLIVALLLIVGVGAVQLSRTDLLIAQNFLNSTKALWMARSGTELAKNWLETNLGVTPLPVNLGPETLEDGSYTVDIADLGNRTYRLIADGLGPDGSRHAVEEIVRLPDFTPLAVVTSDGDGLHPDFDEHSGEIGRRIPDFTLDGRNHTHDGTLSATCSGVSPFATTQVTAQDDLTAAENLLKYEIVTRANSFCQADGNDAAGICTPGLFWVRGSEVSPRFTTAACAVSNPACFLNLSLAAAALRATDFPPAANLPGAPADHGPLTAAPGAPPLVRALTATERSRLQQAIDDILQRAAELPEEKIQRITASLTSGAQTYGTWEEPKVTQIEDGAEALDLSGGATINGVGVLIIPRVVRLANATLNWQGIVLILDDGDLRAEDPAACGQILGAVIVRDDAATDRKLDLDLVRRSDGGCMPFTVSYSCESVTRSLLLLMRTISWSENFGV
jgi:hypothetical protein